MKYFRVVLILSLLLSGCGNNGDPQLYQKVLAEQEVYNAALMSAIEGLPEVRQETAALAKSHRELLASQGKKMSEEEHQKMVRGKSAQLPPTITPPQLLTVDLSRLNDTQMAHIETEVAKGKQLATQIPKLIEIQRDHEWLRAELSRLEKTKTAQ